SATHRTQRLFEKIQEDLNNPARALEREGRTRGRRRPRYVIRPVVSDGSLFGTDEKPDPRAYLIRSERHGLPQARHRVILLGVEESVAGRFWRPLKEGSADM